MTTGANNIGEIVMKTSFPLNLEYYKPSTNTIMSIGKEGFVHTGDLGYKDNDGYIYFMERKHQIINRGGKKIFPYFIENIANAHPNMLESAVFGVPMDDSQEEEIKLCIILKRLKQLSHEEFHEYLKEHLAYYMVPRFIEIKQKLRSLTERIKIYLLQKEWNTEHVKNKTCDTKFRNFIMVSV